MTRTLTIRPHFFQFDNAAVMRSGAFALYGMNHADVVAQELRKQLELDSVRLAPARTVSLGTTLAQESIASPRDLWEWLLANRANPAAWPDYRPHELALCWVEPYPHSPDNILGYGGSGIATVFAGNLSAWPAWKRASSWLPTHEAGHALGAGHTRDPSDPWYRARSWMSWSPGGWTTGQWEGTTGLLAEEKEAMLASPLIKEGTVEMPDRDWITSEDVEGRPVIRHDAHPSNYGYGSTAINFVGGGIVIHTPEEEADEIEGTPAWFANPQANASTHFYVDNDGDIYQMVSLAEGAWGQGVTSQRRIWKGDAGQVAPWVKRGSQILSYNWRSIGIEVEGRAASIRQTMTAPQWESLIELVRYLITRYQIPLDRTHIVGHQEIASHKRDPGTFDWGRLMDGLKSSVELDTTPRALDPAPEPQNGNVSQALARIEAAESMLAEAKHLLGG